MPAIIALPASAKEFASGLLIPYDVKWRAAAPEGDKAVPVNIDWGTDGPTGAVHFSLKLRQEEFTVCRSLYVDNTQSGADVTFIFPDTQFEFTVPAGAADLFPVFAKIADFYAVATSAIVGDKTFAQVLNFLPPPLAAYKSVFMQVSAAPAFVPVGANGNTQIVVPGVNGTLNAISILAANVLGGAAAGGATIALQDGTGAALGTAAVSSPAAGTVAPAALVFSLSGLSVRFVNGIKAVVVTFGTAPAGGGVIASLYYRQP